MIGRPPNPESIRQKYRAAYKLEWQANKRNSIKPKIAVLDFETDPFEHDSEVYPFVCEIFDGKNSHVIWEDKFEEFLDTLLRIFEQMESYHSRWIVYAHNGGKFDFMFLVSKLRGRVSFKGRGIMSARFGGVELRDSMHILPAPLRAYKKDDFDYTKLLKKNRHKNEKEILAYLHNDCVYLYDLVTHFTERHGCKLSIGQAAYGILKNNYPIENLGEASDEYLRQWFYGGRVECLQGPGLFEGEYIKEDVNSMYPAVMAFHEHPIGADFSVRSARPGITPLPNAKTIFLEVECDNFGALVARDENGSLTPNTERGLYKTTIWEFRAAEELGLIRNVKIKTCIDFMKRSNFEKFSIPLYENRQTLKDKIDILKSQTGNIVADEISELERELLVEKFLLNNGYGKTAQNPRNFKEYFYTDFDEAPSGVRIDPFRYQDEDGGIWTIHASVEGEFIVWTKPIQTLRFNNVAIGASITGAARAHLLRKLYASNSPIYCDTDSIIYKGKFSDEKIITNKLGEWKHEADLVRTIVCGKKLYGHYAIGEDKPEIKAKGNKGVTWQDLEIVLKGGNVYKKNSAPTIKRTGVQTFIGREISLTVPKNYQSRMFLQ